MSQRDLIDEKVNVRIVLALLWVCHFILWIFGDMFSLLQEMGEPVTDSSILFIAPTTAIVLTLVVVYTLVGRPAFARLANLIVAPIYLLFNVVFTVELCRENGVEEITEVMIGFDGIVMARSKQAPRLAGTDCFRSCIKIPLTKKCTEAKSSLPCNEITSDLTGKCA